MRRLQTKLLAVYPPTYCKIVNFVKDFWKSHNRYRVSLRNICQKSYQQMRNYCSCPLGSDGCGSRCAARGKYRSVRSCKFLFISVWPPYIHHNRYSLCYLAPGICHCLTSRQAFRPHFGLGKPVAFLYRWSGSDAEAHCNGAWKKKTKYGT